MKQLRKTMMLLVLLVGRYSMGVRKGEVPIWKNTIVLLVIALVGLPLTAEGSSLAEWERDGELPHPCARAGVVVLGGEIFVFGGYDGEMGRSESFLYKPGGGSTPKAPMPVALHAHAFSQLGGRAFFFGGHGSGGVDSRHFHARSIDPFTESEWREETELSVARDEAIAAGVGSFVYLLTGHSQKPDYVIKTIERYDPEEFGFWEERASLAEGRRYPGVAVVNDQIYVIGGYDNQGDTFGSMERYDPEADTVSFAPEMITPRSHMGVSVVGDRIYTFGGLRNSQYMDVVEYFDVSENRWFSDRSLPLPLCAVGAVTIEETVYLIGGQPGGGSPPSRLVYRSAVDLSATNSVPSVENTERSLHVSVRYNQRGAIILAIDAADGLGLGGDELRSSDIQFSTDLVLWRRSPSLRLSFVEGQIIVELPNSLSGEKLFFRVLGE